jgi:heme-degrading monooxygenase HmoA
MGPEQLRRASGDLEHAKFKGINVPGLSWLLCEQLAEHQTRSMFDRRRVIADDVARDQEIHPMFIAMNRFRVAKGSEKAFEKVWLSRDSYLDRVPGFVEFRLLKGPEAEDHTLYASHTCWESRTAFEAWTRSEAFRAAHHRAGENKPLYLDHPQFEGFEVCQTIGARKKAPVGRTDTGIACQP